MFTYHIHDTPITSTTMDLASFWLQQNALNKNCVEVFSAGQQISGRGRYQRAWDSPSGNLHATAILPLKLFMGKISVLPFLTCITLGRVFRSMKSDIEVQFKWPNDILISGKKVAGILIEIVEKNGESFALVGFGVNVIYASLSAPYPTTSLSLEGLSRVSARIILRAFCDRICSSLSDLNEGSEASFFKEWMQYVIGLGLPISVKYGHREIEGTLEGFSQGGAALIRLQGGGIENVYSGDVFLINK